MESDDIPIEVLREGARLYEQGQYYESISENKKAIECYEEMMRISFPDPIVLNSIAFCHMLDNEDAKAQDALRKVLELDPEHEEALHNLSLLLIDHNNLDEAEQLTRRALSLDKPMDGNWHNLGRILYLKGQYPEARDALAMSLGLQPDRAGSHHLMALVQQEIGDMEKAFRSFLRMEELENEDAQMLTDFGRFLIRIKQFEYAEKYLRKAVEEDPFDHKPLTFLAEALLEQVMVLGNKASDDMVGEMMDTLNKSLDLEVTHPKTWYLWGRVRILFRDWEEAEKYLRAAVERECEDVHAWAFLAGVLDKLGRKREAEEMFAEYKRRAGIDDD